MKVYLATAGEYSDYRVLHAFAREEDARDYWLGDDVEELEVQEGPVEVRTWFRYWWRPGLPDNEGDSNRISNPHMMTEQRDYDPVLPDASHYWDQQKNLVVQGWDRERVLKVYSEQRAKHQAQEAGV